MMMNRKNATLIVIDVQEKLMPAIDGAQGVISNARRLIDAAQLLDVETVFTEQNAGGIGHTVSELTDGSNAEVFHKKHFDTTREGEILAHIPSERELVVCGCEAHVCVMQTVLGLLGAKRHVFLACDAVGARFEHNKIAAIERMKTHGAEIVTTEMVLFEWLETSDHPRFKDVLKLIR